MLLRFSASSDLAVQIWAVFCLVEDTGNSYYPNIVKILVQRD